jgi:hypothetical protein
LIPCDGAHEYGEIKVLSLTGSKTPLDASIDLEATLEEEYEVRSTEEH